MVSQGYNNKANRITELPAHHDSEKDNEVELPNIPHASPSSITDTILTVIRPSMLLCCVQLGCIPDNIVIVIIASHSFSVLRNESSEISIQELDSIETPQPVEPSTISTTAETTDTTIVADNTSNDTPVESASVEAEDDYPTNWYLHTLAQTLFISHPQQCIFAKHR